jgi:hypothetical protein
MYWDPHERGARRQDKYGAIKHRAVCIWQLLTCGSSLTTDAEGCRPATGARFAAVAGAGGAFSVDAGTCGFGVLANTGALGAAEAPRDRPPEEVWADLGRPQTHVPNSAADMSTL